MPLLVGLILGAFGLGQVNLGLPICSLSGLIGPLNPSTVGRIPSQRICPFMLAPLLLGLRDEVNMVAWEGAETVLFSLQPSANITIVDIKPR